MARKKKRPVNFNTNIIGVIFFDYKSSFERSTFIFKEVAILIRTI